MRFSLLVRETLADGWFVVTNACREDIPKRSRFTTLAAKRSEYVVGNFVLREAEPAEPINLVVGDIETWRKPWHCIPNGHHAAVRFEGEDVAKLAAYLAAHPARWIVSIDAE